MANGWISKSPVRRYLDAVRDADAARESMLASFGVKNGKWTSRDGRSRGRRSTAYGGAERVRKPLVCLCASASNR